VRCNCQRLFGHRRLQEGSSWLCNCPDGSASGKISLKSKSSHSRRGDCSCEEADTLFHRHLFNWSGGSQTCRQGDNVQQRLPPDAREKMLSDSMTCLECFFPLLMVFTMSVYNEATSLPISGSSVVAAP